jgi:hypothetical protein
MLMFISKFLYVEGFVHPVAVNELKYLCCEGKVTMFDHRQHTINADLVLTALGTPVHKYHFLLENTLLKDVMHWCVIKIPLQFVNRVDPN